MGKLAGMNQEQRQADRGEEENKDDRTNIAIHVGQLRFHRLTFPRETTQHACWETA